MVVGENVKHKNKKLVLADYFLAFSTREVSGDADVWRLYTEDDEFNPLASVKGNVQVSGDLYAVPGIKEISSTYYPLIGPYDTQDEDVAEYHVLLAKSAGIDGFMGEWAYKGMSRDIALINLAQVCAKYDFFIGANWCEYGHFTWQDFETREEAIEAAKEGFVYLLQHVYSISGVTIDGRELVLMFDSRAEEATSPKQAFFTPDDIKELRKAAQEAGYNPLILTRNINEGLLGTVDGFFSWIPVGGSVIPRDSHWTMVCDRRDQIRFLRSYYQTAAELKKDKKIDYYLGGVWQGFDDHKGQAWGSGEKRYVPRDEGQTLQDTWSELNASETETAMIVAWNDWEEATNIEPSLELGYKDIEDCALAISEWKETQPVMNLLRLPERLFKLRKRVKFLERVNINHESLHLLIMILDDVGNAISKKNETIARDLLDKAQILINVFENELISERVHLLWEFSVPSIGLDIGYDYMSKKIEVDKVAGIIIDGVTPEFKYKISEKDRKVFKNGYFVGHLSFEYLDTGTDFIKVYVDNPRESHQLIADFRKKNTGKWMRATLDLVNASFVAGLPGGADFVIKQNNGTQGGIRLVRIDGYVYSLNYAKK